MRYLRVLELELNFGTIFQVSRTSSKAAFTSNRYIYTATSPEVLMMFEHFLNYGSMQPLNSFISPFLPTDTDLEGFLK
jgi:hypothetical protein